MPRVPVYDTQQVEERPLAPVRFSTETDDSLERIGVTISQGADLLDRRAMEMQEEEDAAELTEAYAAASDALRPVLHGDILTREGKNAFGAYEDADAAMEDIGKNVEGGLRSDSQRAAFKKMWLSQRAGNLNTVARHVAGQRKAYRNNVAEVAAKSTIEDIAANYADPELVAEHMDRGLKMVRANLHGQEPSVVKEKGEAFVSQAHAVILDRMAVSNPLGAKTYYKEHKSEIDGLTQIKIEKLLDAEVLRAESQYQADKIVSTGKGFEEQLTEARSISDPKVRDETVRRVKDRFNEAKAIAAQEESELIEDAGKIVVNGGTLDDLRPEHREALGVSGMASIKSYLKSGGDVVTDLPTYYTLQDMATDRPEDFKKVQLIKYLGKMAKPELDKLYTLQRSMLKGETKDLVLGRTMKQIVDDGLNAAGIKTGAKGNVKKANQFRRWVEEQADLEGIDKNTQDWRNKVQAIVDRGLIEGEVKGGIYDPDKQLFETLEGEKFIIDDVDAIPESEQAKIINALKHRKLPVTDENIIDLYKRKNRIQ